MSDQGYASKQRRPLVILLADITESSVLPDNIKPLEAWSNFDSDVHALDYYRGSGGSPGWGGTIQGVGTRINNLVSELGPSVTVVIGMGGGAAIGLRALQLYVTSPSAFIGVNGVYNLEKTGELSKSIVDAFNIFTSGSTEAMRIVGAYITQMSCEIRENKISSKFIASEKDEDVNPAQSVRMDKDATILAGKTHSVSLYDESLWKEVRGFICDANKRALVDG